MRDCAPLVIAEGGSVSLHLVAELIAFRDWKLHASPTPCFSRFFPGISGPSAQDQIHCHSVLRFVARFFHTDRDSVRTVPVSEQVGRREHCSKPHSVLEPGFRGGAPPSITTQERAESAEMVDPQHDKVPYAEGGIL